MRREGTATENSFAKKSRSPRSLNRRSSFTHSEPETRRNLLSSNLGYHLVKLYLATSLGVAIIDAEGEQLQMQHRQSLHLLFMLSLFVTACSGLSSQAGYTSPTPPIL